MGDLESIMLSEISQIDKVIDSIYISIYMWNLKGKQTNIIEEKQRVDSEGKQMA